MTVDDSGRRAGVEPAAAAAELLASARDRLLAAAAEDGWWEGRLSSSALATAVAVFALSQVDGDRHARLIAGGLAWLSGDQNPDGGWGDSPGSPSNLSATALCRAAFSLAHRKAGAAPAAAERADRWLAAHAAGTPAALYRALVRRYGNDRTFATPILAMCALGGLLGPARQAWRWVPQLPFELSAFPWRFYRALRLTVVSYALPALIALGLLRHRRRPCRCPIKRRLRDALTPRLLAAVRRMQPRNGGYEEATPLTGFVIMSLSAAGHAEHPVVAAGERFLVGAARPDGSWPIDTNLATWVTTLSVRALRLGAATGGAPTALDDGCRRRILAWLLRQQFEQRHPLSFGAAGGWSWTDLPGGMPDADDTSGALLALHELAPDDPRAAAAAARGIVWLLDLQNRDGGIPTFSRGWGRLPFDRSCPDITAHAVRAFAVWRTRSAPDLRRRAERAAARCLRYLERTQREDGAWVPLWFGNQWTAEAQENPCYGTAQVLAALRDAGAARPGTLSRARDWLLANQNPDGGWGGARGAPSTVEETALALRALAGEGVPRPVLRGLEWLRQATAAGTCWPAAPIGLYFAKLWYSEEMYPLVFAADALAELSVAGQEKWA